MKSKYFIGIPSTLFISLGILSLLGQAAILMPVLTGGINTGIDEFVSLVIRTISAIMYIAIGFVVRKGDPVVCIFAAAFSMFWILISPFYLLAKAPITIFVNALMIIGVVLELKKKSAKKESSADVGIS